MPKAPARIIFLIDDDAGHLAICERALKREGYLVLTARDGAEAMRVLARTSVDLAMVDIFMPNADGFEVIQSVRRRTPGVKIVAMSGGSIATDSADVLAQAKKLGARAVLEKPFSAEQLITTVRSVLGG